MRTADALRPSFHTEHSLGPDGVGATMDFDELAEWGVDPDTNVYEVEFRGDKFLVYRAKGRNGIAWMPFDLVSDGKFDDPEGPRALSYAAWEAIKSIELSGPPIGTLKNLGFVGVKSETLAVQPQSERFFRLAIAYLGSAKKLTNQLRDQIDSSGWEDASVILYCSFHSVELFYKATILAANPGENIRVLCHSISSLKRRYMELYPNQEDHFSSVFDLTFGQIRKAFGHDDEPILEDFYDQLYKYMSDKRGRGPSGFHFFQPYVWLKWLSEREEHWTAIWRRTKARSF